MLCAQHALNALLQGNYFDPSQLAEIAKQLDELERSQLDDDAWRNRDTASFNMDDTGELDRRFHAPDSADLCMTVGYFSVSVLERALEVWGLSLIRWRSAAMREYQSKPEEQLGFVLNLESHWFTIRGFRNGYW
jgi:ataxin-3